MPTVVRTSLAGPMYHGPLPAPETITFTMTMEEAAVFFDVWRDRAVEFLSELAMHEVDAGRNTAVRKLDSLALAIELSQGGMEFSVGETRAALDALGRQTRAKVPDSVVSYVESLVASPDTSPRGCSDCHCDEGETNSGAY
jgi:hypothetical protein